MERYLNILRDIVDNGFVKQDRTGTGTIAIAGAFFKHDMSEGFPVLTTKRVPFNLVASELEFFIKGITDKKWLQERNNHIWDEWCSPDIVPYGHSEETKKAMAAERDLGPVYGWQWRHYNGRYIDYSCNDYANLGGVDQLKNLVGTLKTNPDDRRMLVVAWNPMMNNRMALPPCFKGNSLVLTTNGYKKIKDIIIGDYVFSDDGKYHKVYDIQKTEYTNDIIGIKTHYSNIAIKSTPNHEHETQRGFISAENITTDDFLAISINTKSEIPSITYNQKINQYQDINVIVKLDNADDWYIMGYWLGDGWFRHDRKGIVFSVANKDIEKISIEFSKTDIKTQIIDTTDNVSKLYNQNNKWYYIMRCFTGGSKTKTIPDWVFDAPVEYIERFLDGYFDADGCVRGKETIYTTISPSIAYGLQRLYLKLHKHISIYYQKRSKKAKIGDRVINQNNTFSLTSRSRSNGNVFYIDDNKAYYKVKEICKSKNDDNFVYNLSVEDSHTYTVNNHNTHNCHWAFQVTVTDDRLNLMWNQRSVDAFLGLPFNITSYALLLHLLAKECSFQEGYLCGFLGDVHIYKTHLAQVNKQLARTPMSLPEIETTNFTSIFDWVYTDSTLLDYKHHPGISAPIAV